MDFTASTLYGPHRAMQPTPTPTADHPAGTPEPTARTEPTESGPLANPILLLVGIIGLAVLLSQVVIRGEVKVG